jgi:tetratricopeptide (TPR) repeat protein
MHYCNGQLEKALDVYNKIIKLDDNNEAKNYKFNILIQHHQYTKAYNLLTQMNIEYTIINRNLNTLAEKLQENRKYTESLQVYQRIFKEIHSIDSIDKIKYLLLKTENTQKLHNCKYYMDWINLINQKYESDTICPNCQNKLTPILYGYPSPEAMKDADKEEIILGG